MKMHADFLQWRKTHKDVTYQQLQSHVMIMLLISVISIETHVEIGKNHNKGMRNPFMSLKQTSQFVAISSAEIRQPLLS